MDQIHWLPDWVERTTEEKLPLIMAVEAQERWIIEGGVSTRYAARLARADMLIWLDLPIGLRLWRVLRRAWRYRGQTRPDLPAGCPEQFNRETFKFMRWTWDNRQSTRDKVVNCLSGHKGDSAIHHLTTRRAVKEFMCAFQSSQCRL